MWNNLVGALGTIPPDFPEKINVPQTFLYQINTTFWIWFIRVALILALGVVLFFANSSIDISNSYSEHSEKENDEYEAAPINEEKVKK